MMQVESLLGLLTDQLEHKIYTPNMVGTRPRVPMMILYMGDRAFESQKRISGILRQAWRRRSEAISHLKMDSGKYFKESPDTGQIEEIGLGEFQREVDDMYAREDCYYDMNDLFICTVIDTRDCRDIDVFCEKYEKITEIKEFANQTYCLTMSIVLLDESAAGSGVSVKVRQYLRERLEKNERLYRSTVILSNRLNRRGLLQGERRKENDDLIGIILVLANSIGSDYTAPLGLLFPPDNSAYYITAAYSQVRRPNRKIVEILLHTLLVWLEEKLTEGHRLSLNEICDKLEIKGGSSQIILQYFEQNVRHQLPDPKVLEYLPRLSKVMSELRKIPFIRFNQESMGAVEKFYEKEYLPPINETMGDFTEKFEDYISRRFRAGEANASLTEQMISQLLDQMHIAEPSQELPAEQYLLEKAKADFQKMILPYCRELLIKLKETSETCTTQLTKIINEFRDGFFIETDEENLKNFYTALANRYLQAEQEKILEEFGKTEKSKEGMLEVFGDIVRHIIGSDTIFELSLVDEMIKRMGKNPIVIQQTLQTELLSEISDRIRLRSVASLDMLEEIFIINQLDKKGQNTMFYNYLRELKAEQHNTDFFDSGNSNSVGVIRLYRCDASSL